ncbi:MAG TPA: response regulator transcription factor [Bacteroidales bacterium]|nr:response regulator transcription factor [Bacteroidales bacterium]
MSKARILVVEDELRLAEVLKKQIEEAGFSVQIANDGYTGKRYIEANKYDLAILDINIPIINGYDLCKEIRRIDFSIPIIMLTALGTLDNKISGFDAGADDYVTKPYEIRELLARINVFLKRSDVDPSSHILSVADLRMDLVNKTVTRAGEKIDLTVKEFSLLELFMKNKGKLLSREFIINKVWGIDFDPGTNVIDVYVNYLRKKIDKDFDLKLIHTKFGFGFYLNESEI